MFIIIFAENKKTILNISNLKYLWTFTFTLVGSGIQAFQDKKKEKLLGWRL